MQLGNCGSPIETEAGWLVLTHGVGLIRNANERDGDVPDVVYSCGALVHGRELVIPYAMSDYASTFATGPLDNVLGAMARTCGQSEAVSASSKSLSRNSATAVHASAAP